MKDRNKGRRLFRIGEAALITRGSIVRGHRSEKRLIENVVIDSREVRQGSLFIALAGERTDGHRYLKEAENSGALCILINRSMESSLAAALQELRSAAVIAVDDTYEALRALAGNWVARFPGLVRIGVTGSSGKTTTKELISTILSEVDSTVKNPGNFNSDIGLPLSVFNITSEHTYGVFEMGISHVQEMDRMLRVYTPDVSIMTNIGTAHIGLLGSQEGIVREKSKIFHTAMKDGYILEGSVWKDYIERLRKIELQAFGSSETTGFGGARSLGLNGWLIDYEQESIHLPLIGSHNLLNSLGAIRIARDLGADPVQIKRGLERCAPLKGRGRVIKGNVTVIEDSYNSNIEAAQSMMSYVNGLPWEGRKNLVLGSLKELGGRTDAAHRIIGSHIAEMGLEGGAFLYGKEMESAYALLKDQNYAGELFYTDDYQELEAKVTRSVHRGDLVLLKGSRSMQMERLVSPLSHVS